jgi:plastocyanin
VIRRPVSGGPVDGAAVANTVVIGRTYNPATGTIGATESFAVAGMAPTHLRVPVGTTVTFTNHPGNAGVRGVTQFFEGLFDVRLDPGESFQYTFTRTGEYFFNDPASPRSTGKVEVY